MAADKDVSILVVDDDSFMRLFCHDTLKEDYAHIDTAKSAEDALKMFEEKYYQIVILDIGLPGMNGVELSKEIHKRSANTSIIIMTAKPDINSAIETLKTGASDYLFKPFSPEQLLDTVRNAVTEKPLILILDDDLNVVKLLTKIIVKNFPHSEVIVDYDGSRIDEIFRKNKINLAFIDIRLRNRDGLDLIEKYLGAHILPEDIVIISSYSDRTDTAERIKEMGISSVIKKPFTSSKIVEVLYGKFQLE